MTISTPFSWEQANQMGREVNELVTELLSLDIPGLSKSDVIHVATAAQVAVEDALCKKQRCPICGSLSKAEKSA